MSFIFFVKSKSTSFMQVVAIPFWDVVLPADCDNDGLGVDCTKSPGDDVDGILL